MSTLDDDPQVFVSAIDQWFFSVIEATHCTELQFFVYPYLRLKYKRHDRKICYNHGLRNLNLVGVCTLGFVCTFQQVPGTATYQKTHLSSRQTWLQRLP